MLLQWLRVPDNPPESLEHGLHEAATLALEARVRDDVELGLIVATRLMRCEEWRGNVQ